MADFIIGAGTLNLIDTASDLSPYILVKKDNMKLLVHIHKYVLEVIELPESIDEKKFVYNKNNFTKTDNNLRVERIIRTRF